MQYTKRHLVIIRDLMLEDLSDDEVVKRLSREEFPDTTRNSLISLWNRGRIHLVSDAEQVRKLESFRAMRSSSNPSYNASSTNASRNPARKSTKGRKYGAYVPGKRRDAPPDDELQPEERKWDTIASKIQAELDARKPTLTAAQEAQFDHCRFPGCTACTLPRLFGGRFEIPASLRALGDPIRMYCVYHAYRSFAKSGRIAMRNAFEEAGILVS